MIKVMLMKIKTASKPTIRKKIVFLLAFVVLLIAALAIFFLYNNDNSTSGDTSNNTDLMKPNQGIIDNPKESLVADDTSSDEDNTTDETVTIEAPVITRAEVSGGFIRVAAIFSSPSDGNCRLVMSNGENTLERTARVVVGSTYYSCDGFRLSASDMPEKGEWSLYVLHENSGKTAKSEVKTISLE